MNVEDEQEIELTQRELERLRREQPELTGDALLNAASKAAGYIIELSSVEMCNQCGKLYNTDYGGDYVDANDLDDLLVDCSTPKEVLLTLECQHFCNFQCLMQAVYEAEDRLGIEATQ